MRTVLGALRLLVAGLLIFGLASGALLISWVVGEWVSEQTSNPTLGVVVGLVLASCFVVNLAIQIGTFNYLQLMKKGKPQLSEDLKAWLYPNAR
jgi:hypothetical protein